MGNWNRRWPPRKKYRQEHSDSEFYHMPHHSQPQTFGVWKSNIPSWEKQFCIRVGAISWEKVMVGKSYMHCHENVVKWNDSAGEEAFNNAKERFWAALNGLPCDIPVSDPNKYIDDIDWNPVIDPGFIYDLEQEYFNPDEGEKSKKVETAVNDFHKLVSGNDGRWHGNLGKDDNPWEGNLDKDNNPWEGNNSKGTEALKIEAQGWNLWDASIDETKNLNNAENPWEQNNTRVKRALNDSAGVSSAHKSWGWNQGQEHHEWSNNFYSQWGCGWQNVGYGKEKGWWNSQNSSRGWDRRGTVCESRLSGPGGNTSIHKLNQVNRGLKDRGCGDCWDREGGWKQSGQNNDFENLDFRSGGRAWGAMNAQRQRTEGSHQYSSRHKSSRFQGNDCTPDYPCRKGKNQKRASFA